VLVVVALGGNAFNRPGDPITQEAHLKNADWGKPWLSDLLAALGCPVGGSLVPPIGRFHPSFGGRSGRLPHVKSLGATPQATTHVRINEGLILINSALGSPVVKKWGYPAYRGPFSRY